VSPSRPPICDYEGSDYQTSFWDQGGRAYEDAVEAIALKRLLPAQGQRLLDIGAGAGRNAPRYAGFSQVILLDYSRSMLEQAQARLGRDERYLYIAADAYRLPFVSGLFDTVSMIRVLHHMADPQAALHQARRVMADQGAFVLEFANKRNLKAIMRWLARRQAWSPFDPSPIEFVSLHYDFHPRTIRRWLGEQGLVVERTLTVSHFRAPLFKQSLPMAWLTQMDSIAQWTGGLWQLSPSVFVRSRAGAPLEASAEGAFWQCPRCGSVSLSLEAANLRCQGCRSLWERRDGIYDFRQPGGDDGAL
jgi:ubiquinone/menaquinone biosynthesis C-methylase UbiE/predicted RNA-binding Zn-ribbon protein involved in translation (DUF1610 family)